MEIEEAQALVAAKPPTVSEHRQVLADLYAGAPQRAAGVDLAMKQIEDGLTVLAQHGHRYVLVEQVEPPVGDRFPMMLYRQPGETRTVDGDLELEEAKSEGWREQQAMPRPEPEAEPKPAPEPEPESSAEPGQGPEPDPNSGEPLNPALPVDVYKPNENDH